jgi:hypothetical protein
VFFAVGRSAGLATAAESSAFSFKNLRNSIPLSPAGKNATSNKKVYAALWEDHGGVLQNVLQLYTWLRDAVAMHHFGAATPPGRQARLA